MILRLLLVPVLVCGLAIAEEPAISFSVVDQNYGGEPIEPPKDQLGKSPFAVLGYDHVAISRAPGLGGDDLQVIARVKPLLAGLVLAAPPADFQRQNMYGEGSLSAMLMKGDAVLGFVSIASAGDGLLAIFKQDGVSMYYLEKAKP